MYKGNNPLPADYSEWAKTRTVYKCKKDIECKDGVFTKGSFVMLDVCSAEKGEVYVIDFASVLKNRFFYYTNDITGENIEHDIAVLLPNQLVDCFDEAKELSHKINNHNKYINWSAFIGAAIAVVLMIIFMIIVSVSGYNGAANSPIFFVVILMTVIGVFGFDLVTSVKLSKELECIIAEENNRDNVSP